MHLYTPDQQDKHRTLLREIEELEKRIVNWDASHRDPASVAKKLVDLSPPAATWSFPLDGTETGLVGTATKFNGDDAVAFPLNQPHPTDQGKTIQKQFGRETSFSFSIWLYPDHYGDREVIAHQSVAAEDAAFRGLQLVLDQGKPQFSLIHFWPGDGNHRLRLILSLSRNPPMKVPNGTFLWKFH